jgi:hypothetical protein
MVGREESEISGNRVKHQSLSIGLGWQLFETTIANREVVSKQSEDFKESTVL